jgi:urease accessory protein
MQNPMALMEKFMNKKLVSLLALCLLSTPAFAHPGHAQSGLLAGFAHPFTGIDHLLVMLAVGIWAGRIGGAARWQLPAAFLAAMTAGWGLGISGVALPHIESAIAASLFALGLLVAHRFDWPRALQLGLTALFALLHGFAHGTELSAAPAIALGFLTATAALQLAGLTLVALLPEKNQRLYRAAGALLAVLGGGLLLQ